MSQELSYIPVRCQLIARSNPPVYPIDGNTEAVPQTWRGQEFCVDAGVFYASNEAIDLGNLAYMECDIFPMPIPNDDVDTNYTNASFSNLPFPTTPPAPLLNVTLESDDITPLITRNAWEEGTAQNARFLFSFVQMQSLDLGGDNQRQFWMVFSGRTTGGKRIVYGGGPLIVFESGVQTIYLPNNLAPVLIPEGTTLYIPDNQQMPFAIPIVVEGILDVEGILVDVS